MLKQALLATAIISSVFSLSANANIVILGTRAIYEESKSNLGVQLKNNGDSPALVQAWIDDGVDDMEKAKKAKVPFIITPPVVRVEGNKGQSLVIRYTGDEKLPKDRESVFYLNVLDVPPKPKAEDLNGAVNYIQMAVRSRIKLFYRPKGIGMAVMDSYDKVTWHLVGKDDKVKINNPTPYHITYNYVQVGEKVSYNVEMLKPYSELEVVIPDVKKGDKVEWQAINDYGGDSNGESIIE